MTTVTHRPHKVFLAEHWADDWEEQTGLYCDECRCAAWPSVSSAKLSFLFGYIERANSEKVFFEGPKSIDEWYVKVEIDQGKDSDGNANPPIKWIGLVVHSTKHRQGTKPGYPQPGGLQTFECRGLEFLFQRTTLDR